MDILESEGYSIIESVVSVVLLGITAAFILIFVKMLLIDNQALLSRKADYFAREELYRCKEVRHVTDTTYIVRSDPSLEVRRVVLEEGKLLKVDVSVYRHRTDSRILTHTIYLNSMD